MTIPQVVAVGVVTFLNGFAIAVVLYRHYVMKPRWETESELRKELKKVRGDLYVAKHGRPLDHKFDALPWSLVPYGLSIGEDGKWIPTPEGKVPHRAHSPVLKINSIDDLIQGTK